MLFSFYLSRLFSVSFAQPVSLDLPVCLYFAQFVCIYLCISLGLSIFSQSVSISLNLFLFFPVCIHLSHSVSISISSLSFSYFYFLAFEAIRSMSSELIV